MEIELYTDGSGTTDNKPGGWAAILVRGALVRELSGGAQYATNNQMEITAVLEGLRAIKARGATVIIYTDSEVVIHWLTKEKSRKNGFARKACAEIDGICVDMDLLIKPVWVKGHSGNDYNERADFLAGVERKKRIEKEVQQVQESNLEIAA